VTEAFSQGTEFVPVLRREQVQGLAEPLERALPRSIGVRLEPNETDLVPLFLLRPTFSLNYGGQAGNVVY
jgi:hypothetical protein